jgi:hypothetical protein
MRVIEKQMNDAINDCVDWKKDNTEVITEGNISRVFLYGNQIATIGETFVQLFDGGHQTVTTKSRLNAILSEHGCGNRIYQKDWQWFVSTKEGDLEFNSGMKLR